MLLVAFLKHLSTEVSYIKYTISNFHCCAKILASTCLAWWSVDGCASYYPHQQPLPGLLWRSNAHIVSPWYMDQARSCAYHASHNIGYVIPLAFTFTLKCTCHTLLDTPGITAYLIGWQQPYVIWYLMAACACVCRDGTIFWLDQWGRC